MRLLPTSLDGPVVVEPVIHRDERGFFLETYRADVLGEAGIDLEFVQDNHSRSRRGIVRGMHFQPGQTKLVRCVRGEILDVVTDIRVGSPMFGRWEAFELNDTNHRQALVPDGFAHGFCVLSDVADVTYKVSSYHDATTEGGFRYDDPEVGIQWPTTLELSVSARDRAAPLLAELVASLPFRYSHAA